MENAIKNLNETLRKVILAGYDNLELARADCGYISQSEALLYLLRGDNVFLSGPAGSGKSYLIQKYCEIVQTLNPFITIYRTSTTGLSATNIGGITIHSYAGMGANSLKYEEALKLVKKGDRSVNWRKSDNLIRSTDILIVDEISMLSKRGLHYLLERLKQVKYNYRNIQIIFCGDFSQLPPVNASRNEEDRECSEFCYRTADWNEIGFTELYIDKLYRTADAELSRLLTDISLGRGLTQENIDTMRAIKITKDKFQKGHALLLSTNAKVDSTNATEQAKNTGKLHRFETLYGSLAVGKAFASEKDLEVAKRYGAPDFIELKEGDTVMITSNFPVTDKSIYLSGSNFYCKNPEAPVPMNGMIGVFGVENNTPTFTYTQKGSTYVYYLTERIETATEKTIWVTKEDKKEQRVIKEGSFHQYPLKLAYAITIHKSQGQTFSNVIIDLSNCWMKGLGYVSLSRATSLDGITLISEDGVKAKVKKTALQINEESLSIKESLLQTALDIRDDFENIESTINSIWEVVNTRFSKKQNPFRMELEVDEAMLVEIEHRLSEKFLS